MVTSGYGMGKVWHNGRLKEDFEIIGKEDHQGLQLVVRDKDEVEYMRVPSEKLFEIVLQETQPHPCLERRIGSLLATKKAPKRKTRKTKAKKSKARKSRVKRVTRRKRSKKC